MNAFFNLLKLFKQFFIFIHAPYRRGNTMPRYQRIMIMILDLISMGLLIYQIVDYIFFKS